MPVGLGSDGWLGKATNDTAQPYAKYQDLPNQFRRPTPRDEFFAFQEGDNLFPV